MCHHDITLHLASKISANNALEILTKCNVCTILTIRGANMLKELRLEKKLTQKEVAELLGISLRSYKSYENDSEKKDTIKYRFLVEQLLKINQIDEEHGLLDISDIKKSCADIFTNYDVSFCYLFGSYAKNCATEKSDVDLLISTSVTGLKFYGMVEELRERLHKNVDLLEISQLKDNFELTKEILEFGVRIYG